jgi:hypothetical protein
MKMIQCVRAGLLLGAALVPLGTAGAASCPSGEAKPLSIGTVTGVEPGEAQAYSLALEAGEGVIVDLTNLTSAEAEARDGEDSSPPRSLAMCGADGALLTPQAGEVFEKGGSLSAMEEGERLRFVAPASGDYLVGVASADAPREILVRRRDIGAQSPVVAVELGNSANGKVSSAAPRAYSFTGKAGEWVELRVTSEKDTLLRLAGPDAEGTYAVVGENDDSEGLNPMLRRRLRTAGTYFVQVDSLDAEAANFELTLETIDAPASPPAPAVLRLGAELRGRLEDGDAVDLYAMPVVAGHEYRLELTAPYDSALSIGLPNPVEADDGGRGQDSGFSEVKSQDENLTGTERLNFTARNAGTLLVRVKSFGLDDTEGNYTLKAVDLGE